jgi:OOP family OmpA-OmpF porin
MWVQQKRGFSVKNGRLVMAILGLVAAAAAFPAAAQDDKGLYLGGSFGTSAFKNVCSRAIVPCDDKDQAWRFFGGYQFNRYVAAELGYGDLGAATGNGDVPGTGGADGQFKAAVKEAWDLSAVFRFNVVGNLSALGRVGAYRVRTTVDFEGAFPDAPTHEAGTNSGFTYGAGLEYLMFSRLGLRAEWQRYDNVGVGSTGEDDIDVLNIGVLFRF